MAFLDWFQIPPVGHSGGRQIDHFDRMISPGDQAAGGTVSGYGVQRFDTYKAAAQTTDGDPDLVRRMRAARSSWTADAKAYTAWEYSEPVQVSLAVAESTRQP